MSIKSDSETNPRNSKMERTGRKEQGTEKTPDVRTVRNRMAWMCARREYCSGDILKKLRNCGIEGKEAFTILRSLQDAGYVDDERYVSAFVRDKALISGWGGRKIAYSLKARGLSSDLVESAVGELVSDEVVSRKMQTVVERKWQSLKDQEPRARIAKTLRYALGRGYDYEEVMEFINSRLRKPL